MPQHSAYPDPVSKYLPSHHALIVRVLADVRRGRSRITEFKHGGQIIENLNEAMTILYGVVMTLEMELNFDLRKALSKMEEEE